MRVAVLATILLVSTCLCPSLAQEAAKPPIATPQTVPAQPEQNSPQRAERERHRDDAREMGRDGRMGRGDNERMAREDREMRPDRRMYRERDDDRDSDKDRGRYADRDDRDNRGGDRADRGRGYRDASDEEQPRRRVKVCIEYESGDEYCRYRNR